MKRLVSAILLLSFLLIFPAAVFAESGSSGAKLTIESKTCNPGDTVQITVSLSGAPALKTLGFNGLTYNHDVLTLNEAGTQWLVSGALGDINRENGSAVITFSKNTSINGPVMTLSFTVSDTAAPRDYSVGFQPSAKVKGNNGEEPLQISGVSGNIAVEAAPGAFNPVTISKYAKSLSLDDFIVVNVISKVTDFGDFDANYVMAHGGLLEWLNTSGLTDENATYEAAQASGYVIPTLMRYSSLGQNYFVQQTLNIVPREYDKPIKYRTYVELPDGTYVYSELLEYSVFTYCNNQIDKTSATQELKELCMAIKDYGTKANAYFLSKGA